MSVIQAKLTDRDCSGLDATVDPHAQAKVILFPQLAAVSEIPVVSPYSHVRSPYLFAARLRSVAVLNKRKDRKQPVARANGRANLKAKPVVLAATQFTRGPDVFAKKRQSVKAQKATNRILLTVASRYSAKVIEFPNSVSAHPISRLRRAA